MVEAELNVFDAIVLLIVLLSTLLAFFRGFVREVLSLGAWVGAALITIYSFGFTSEWLLTKMKPIPAYLIAGLGVYITALVTISIINSIIIRYVKDGAEVGMLDNFLGMLFGALRGAFIISLGYLVLNQAIDTENPPEWLKTAQTAPYAKQGAEILAGIAPGYLEDMNQVSEEMKRQREEDAYGVDRQEAEESQEETMFERILKRRDADEQE